MGIIKRGILGGFSGKVANIVGTSWKGRAVMKSLPLSVANPKTAGQVRQRTKFSAISKYASSINSSWIKPLWDRFAGNISGYNDFVSVNIVYVSELGVIDYADLQMSKGDLYNPSISSIQGNQVGSNLIDVTFPVSNGSNGLATDIAYVVAVDTKTNELLGVGSDSNRADGEGQIPLLRPLVSTDSVALYLSFLRADGTLVSSSDYNGFVIG